MLKVTVERDGWYDYKENAWGGAISTLDEDDYENDDDDEDDEEEEEEE